MGKYTSPHLYEFNERISINGENINDHDLERISIQLINVYEESKDTINIVAFDLITMIAFKYFEEMQVDYAVVEVGLGGTLDPTNII